VTLDHQEAKEEIVIGVRSHDESPPRNQRNKIFFMTMEETLQDDRACYSSLQLFAQFKPENQKRHKSDTSTIISTSSPIEWW